MSACFATGRPRRPRPQRSSMRVAACVWLLIASETATVMSQDEAPDETCTKSCGGHGSCWRETCFCFMGWEGDDCAINSAPDSSAVGNGLGVEVPAQPDTGNLLQSPAISAAQQDQSFAKRPRRHAGRKPTRGGIAVAHIALTPPEALPVIGPATIHSEPLGSTRDGGLQLQPQTHHSRLESQTQRGDARASGPPVDCMPMDCGDHGVCQVGSCVCDHGFEGAACELTAGTCGELCDGIGVCHSGGLCVCNDHLAIHHKNADCIPPEIYSSLMESLSGRPHKKPALGLAVDGSPPASTTLSTVVSMQQLPSKSIILMGVLLGILLFALGGYVSIRWAISNRKTLAREIVQKSLHPISAERIASIIKTPPSRPFPRAVLPDLDDML